MTLQLVTENGNVFSIDFDELVYTWEKIISGNSTAPDTINCSLPANAEVLICKLEKEVKDLQGNQTNSDPIDCTLPANAEVLICKLEQEVEDLRGNQTNPNPIDCDLIENEEVLVCKLKKQLEEQPDSTDPDFCDDYPDTLVCKLNAEITGGDCNLPGNEALLICRLSNIITVNDPNYCDDNPDALVCSIREDLDELETGIEELEAGTGVGAGALGSSGRLVTIPTEGILSAGVHTVRDTRGTLETPLAYLYLDYDVDWVTLIRDTEIYDEYAVPKLGAEYNANTGVGTLTETSTTTASELNVRGVEPHTAWALLLDGTDDASYAGVTNSAGEVLIPRTSNDGVTITRTTSFNSSSDLDIIDSGSIHDTIIVSKHGTVNDLHVTITSSSSSYRAQLISPDGTNYQVNTSGSYGSKTYVVNAVGEQINGDWTLVYKATSGTRTLQDWTLAINHGSTGKVQSISGSGSQYNVQVSPASSGTFGLDLMNITGIKDSSGNFLDNSRQTGPDEIYDAGGGNLCPGEGFYVCSIERSNPATEQVSTSSVEYLVTFNKDATNVDASDFVSLHTPNRLAPRVNNTPLDVWHTTEQSSPSTSTVFQSAYTNIRSAKLILNASSTNNFANEWSLNLTAPDGTNMIITDTSTERSLKSEGGFHKFYLGEVVGSSQSRGNWVLSVIDTIHDDDPTNTDSDTTTPFTVEEREGQINSWSLELEFGSTFRVGTIGTVLPDGADNSRYIVPVNSISHTANEQTLWLKGDNDIEQMNRGIMIDPREEFAPDPHESYNRGSVSIPSTPHVRGITVSSSTSNSVTFQVMFSEAVIGVNAADFIVIENGTPELSGPQESTYSNSPNISINSNAVTTVSDTISINGYTDGVVDTFTLNVDILHTRIGDLEVELVGPDGTMRNVHNNAGGTTSNIISSFTPNFAGKEINGDWTLQVRDNGSTQSFGTINSWSLDFSYEDTPTYDELLLVETNKGTTYTWKDFLPGNYNLRIYPDAAVHITPCASNGIMIDGHNANSACIPNDRDEILVYTVSAYMRYPVTVDVDLRDIRMTEPGKPDVRLGYLDSSYTAGSVVFIPVIPKMQTLEMKIAGSDTVVHFADIAEPVNILSIPYATGNPAVSTVSMFATATGDVTAYVELSTSRGVSAGYTFDYTARYNSLETDWDRWYPGYSNPTAWENANKQIRMQQHIFTNARNNWATIIEDSVSVGASNSLYVDIDVYRNGDLVLSESIRTSQNANNLNIQAGTPFRGSVSVSSSSNSETVSERLSFYAEVGDYIEISITSRSGTNTNIGYPPTTPPGTATLCQKYESYETYGYVISSFPGPISCPAGDKYWGTRSAVFNDNPAPAEFSSSGTARNEIGSGYIIIVN